jgi:hypothetical protein
MQPDHDSAAEKVPPIRLWEIIALALILGLALLTRLPRLDQYANPDEPYWLVRSANFYYALGQRDFAGTFQVEHPGVTTMWAGTLGFLWQFPEYRGTGVGAISIDNHEAVFEQFAQQPIDVLAAGRMFMVLGICGLLLTSHFYSRQLLGVPAALLGLALIALDPMHIGLSRWLHTDAIQSTPMLLSALALLVFLLRGRRLRHLLVSGAAAGLALLTKSPALFLLPYTGLLLLIDLWYQYRNQQQPFRRLLWGSFWPLLLWSISAAVIFIASWPAMWVAPWDSLNRMVAMALVSSRYGHITSLFFNGELIADGAMGIEHWYFYPLTFLWRTTPLVLLGLALAGSALWLRQDPCDRPVARRTIVALVLFALFYTLMVSLSAKRFDRYLLPAYGPLDLVAGAGWAFLAAVLGRSTTKASRRLALPLLFTGLVTVQMLYVLPTYPYYVSYYNPLMGGSARAPEVMMIGFGEGLDEAARYLNQKAKAENLTTAVWYDTGPYSYFTVGESVYINITNDITRKRLETLLSADYMVIYIHQWQRQIPKPLLEILAEETPEKIITINGLDYATIYDLRDGALLEKIP